jgi:hypothetical protein
MVAVLSRLKNFLPEMAQANARLEDDMKVRKGRRAADPCGMAFVTVA